MNEAELSAPGTQRRSAILAVLRAEQSRRLRRRKRLQRGAWTLVFVLFAGGAIWSFSPGTRDPDHPRLADGKADGGRSTIPSAGEDATAGPPPSVRFGSVEIVRTSAHRPVVSLEVATTEPSAVRKLEPIDDSQLPVLVAEATDEWFVARVGNQMVVGPKKRLEQKP